MEATNEGLEERNATNASKYIGRIWFGLAVAVGGLAPPARAAPAENAAITIRPFAGVAPAVAFDLSGSSTSVIGQMRLNWTGPAVYPGSALDSYQIRVHVLQPADFGGSVLAWWNSPGGTLIQGYYGESPGAAIVRTLGPPGSSHEVTLNPGTRYYVAIRSADDVGVDFNFWSAFSPVVSVLVPAPATAAPPRRPSAIWGTLGNANQFTLHWRAIERDTNNLAVSIDHYEVDRYSVLGGTPTVVASLPSGALSWEDTSSGGGLFYYRVRGISLSAVSSEGSDLVDSSTALNRYALAPDDVNSRMVVPEVQARLLRAEYASYGEDIEIVAVRQTSNENDEVLKSYRFEARRAASGQVISDFVLPEPAPLQIGYGISAQGVISAAATDLNNPSAQAEAVAQIASLYWFNGAQYIRLGATIIVSEQAFRVATKNLGVYEIRAIQAPTQFGLSRGSPYPRVITPNASENRRTFFFVDNPTGEQIAGTIYDLRGAKVRELRINSLSPTNTALVWDGRDENGAVVPSGVYLYEVRAGKDKVTGTLVVAR